MYLMTCTRPDLAYPLSILARYFAPTRHRQEHWETAKRVLRYLCSTSGMGLVLGGRGPVVLTGHACASWELRWLTYLLTDLGERPRSSPVLYVDNTAMIALCQEHILEHRTKHIALRYFLALELQQRGQLRFAYVATRANIVDIFTKALQSGILAAATTTAATNATTATAATTAPAYCTTMASLRVLAFDHEGRPVQFDTWLDDLQLYLLSDSKDSVSLLDLASGAATAPPATADSAIRSQWLTRDASARLAIRNHLPLAESAHFRQHRTAQALYDAVVARYYSPATAALGQLLLPYLFPKLSAFATVEDLVSHLRTSGARYRATIPTEFLDRNQPPMFIALYFIVTRLPDSLRSVRDQFLSLDPTSLNVDLLEHHLLAAETSAVVVDAARGTPRPPFFERCSPSPLAPSYAIAAAADQGWWRGSGSGVRGSGGGSGGSGGGGSDGSGGESGGVGGGGGFSGVSGGSGGGGTGGGETCTQRGVSGGGQRQQQQRQSETHSPQQLREWFLQRGASGGSVSCPYVIRTGDRAGQTCGRLHTQHRCFSQLDDAWSSVAIFDLVFDAIISAMYALSVSVEGDCYRSVPPDPGIAAAALGASESGTLPGIEPAEALHTFTLDSGALGCFFRDSTTLTPFPAPVLVRLADPSGGPVVARSSTVLPCPAVPFGSLSGLHLPSFSTNLLSTAALQNAMVTTTTPGGQRVSICMCTRTGRHLAMFTRCPGLTLYTLATEPPQVAVSAQVLGVPSSSSLTPPLLCPPPDQSELPLQPASPYTEKSGSLTERHEPASHPVSPIRTARRVPRSRPPPVHGTHTMALRPSSVTLRSPPPAPPESSLPEVPDPSSYRARAASPTVARLLAPAVTEPYFESAAAFAIVAELLDIAAACRLDYATALVAKSTSARPLSVGGECALGTDVLEESQEDFDCLAATVPRFASMLLAPEGDPDAPDIPTPRSYAKAITGPYSTQWQAAMDAEMASWKSTGTYVDEVPQPGANIVDGMWIFKGVDYFQTFSPTPKMTTLRVLLHVAAQRDYVLHSLDFSTAFLQGSLHEEIWLRRPPRFTESFPAGTQWSLRRPVYGLRQAPREWHDTLRTTLVALGFTPSTADPSLFLCTNTTLPPFYVLVYIDDLVFATADTEALTLSHMVHRVLQHFGFQFSSPQPTPLSTSHSLSAPPSDESVEPSGPYPELVGCLMYLMTCTRPDLTYPLRLLARYVAPGRHRKVQWGDAKRVLRYLCSTSGMGLLLGGRGPVVLTGHADASWVDDSATQRSSHGYTFSLGSGSVSLKSTRSSLVLSSNCEAEIYARAMCAQELRWITYRLTDLGEQPRSPPVLYVDNKAMIVLCQEHRLEHRTKHIALRYFLARELQQRGYLRLPYLATRVNTADVFTKALPPGDHQHFSTVLGLVPTLPYLLTT
ncbi:unnamed protein product [Closterium sp. NIES-54]